LLPFVHSGSKLLRIAVARRGIRFAAGYPIRCEIYSLDLESGNCGAGNLPRVLLPATGARCAVFKTDALDGSWRSCFDYRFASAAACLCEA
jgi:hypothetical protein